MAFWLNTIAIVITALLVYPYLGGGPPRIVEPSNPDGMPALEAGVTRKVLIVGGGVAGLTAALQLAERGFDVTIKEKQSTLGGKYSTETFETLGTKFQLSTGFNAWFSNYHNFKGIRQRLNVDQYYVAWPDNHMALRDYEWENMYSSGPWPLNLVGIILRSPNLSIWTAMKAWRVSLEFIWYDHETVYDRFDHLTYGEWTDMCGVVQEFGDIWLKPVISACFNNETSFSAAELLVYSHFFFLSHAEAERREFSTEDSGTSLINPWVKKLKELGVKFELGREVTALALDPSSGKVTHDVSEPSVRYDYAILALGLGSTKNLIAQSGNTNSESMGKLQDSLDHLPLAQPVKVLKIWFDKQLKDNRTYSVLQTPQYSPVNVIVQLHHIESQYQRWAEKTGGSVMEFHLHSWEYGNITKEKTWEIISTSVYEIFPEMSEENFTILACHEKIIHDIASFKTGTAKYRPRATYPTEVGISNLGLAGDWLYTDYPSALAERAVSTGMEAANQILLSEGVRQSPLVVTTSHGPGVI